MSKVIAVLGASGAQGGSLVRAILADPQKAFSARAITRNVEGDKAKALAAAGATVVAADLDDVASLTAAFEGAYGVFVVTNFWEHFSAAKEIQQIKNVAEAAAKAKVQHVVNSTLEDTRKWVPLADGRMPTLQQAFKVPHFDGKGEAQSAFDRHHVPVTQLLTSFYFENFIGFFPLQENEDGSATLAFPTDGKPMSAVAVEDIGRFAFVLFKNSAYIGKTVGIAGDSLTGAQYAAVLSETLGRKVNYYGPTFDQFRGFGFPGADELGNMFQVFADFHVEFSAARDIGAVKAAFPGLQSFAAWAAVNGSKIPVKPFEKK